MKKYTVKSKIGISKELIEARELGKPVPTSCVDCGKQGLANSNLMF